MNADISSHATDETSTDNKQQNKSRLVPILDIVTLGINIIALCVSIGVFVFVMGIRLDMSTLVADESAASDEANIVLDFTDWTDDTANATEGSAENTNSEASNTRAKEDEIIGKALASDYLTKDSEYAYNPEENMIETYYSGRVFSFPDYMTQGWYIGEDGVWRDKDGYVVVCAPSRGTANIKGGAQEGEEGYVKAYTVGEKISTTHGTGKVYETTSFPGIIQGTDEKTRGFASLYTQW